MTSFRRLVEFAASTPVLIVTGIVATVLLVVAFPAMPIGGDLLDARFGYSHDEAMGAMEAYGHYGRRVYLWASVVLDTLLPIAYAGFLAGILYRTRPREGVWALAALPVAAAVFDLAENAQIIAMLVRYPDVSTGQVGWASLATQLKATAVLASFVLAAASVAWAVARRWIDRRRSSPS